MGPTAILNHLLGSLLRYKMFLTELPTLRWGGSAKKLTTNHLANLSHTLSWFLWAPHHTSTDSLGLCDHAPHQNVICPPFDFSSSPTFCCYLYQLKSSSCSHHLCSPSPNLVSYLYPLWNPFCPTNHYGSHKSYVVVAEHIRRALAHLHTVFRCICFGEPSQACKPAFWSESS